MFKPATARKPLLALAGSGLAQMLDQIIFYTARKQAVFNSAAFYAGLKSHTPKE
jgi:hypothetical protein